MEKIRYRLVYNRKNHLNKQGTALVQVEASLNQRKVNAERKSKVDDNTAKMQSIKWLGV